MKLDYKFNDYLNSLNFLSSVMAVYDLKNSLFTKPMIENHNESVIFFSYDFLKEQNWIVIPLWEGDVRYLVSENGEETYLLREMCLNVGTSNYIHVMAADAAEWEYSKGFSAMTISHKRFDLNVENPSEIFELTETNQPHWGNNFLWPDNRNYFLFTNGDNASFIAGNPQIIKKLIGLDYSYCRGKFISANLTHSALQPALINACVSFCDMLNGDRV